MTSDKPNDESYNASSYTTLVTIEGRNSDSVADGTILLKPQLIIEIRRDTKNGDYEKLMVMKKVRFELFRSGPVLDLSRRRRAPYSRTQVIGTTFHEHNQTLVQHKPKRDTKEKINVGSFFSSFFGTASFHLIGQEGIGQEGESVLASCFQLSMYKSSIIHRCLRP
ncbi:hypothetical protein J6590_053735 [Homalodisca vitripennis]|nr:hypothetical protein J6590_053735 [Homalodisca vitripennis]